MKKSLFLQIICAIIWSIEFENCKCIGLWRGLSMFRGLYAATSGMMAYNRQQQILTNNLSNAVTPGFKSDITTFRTFPQQLIEKMGGPNSNANYAGTLSVGTYAQEAIPQFTQGILKQTANTTDFALQSSFLPQDSQTNQRRTLVFQVQTANNEIRYTQNGQFVVDQTGVLRTAAGDRVLNRAGEQIQLSSLDFKVDDQGLLEIDGVISDSLWIGYASDPLSFVKEGSGLLRYEGAAENAPVLASTSAIAGTGSPLVSQGFLEQSNVDMTRIMTDMLKTYRGFESNQKVIQAYDQSMQKAVTEIGRV